MNRVSNYLYLHFDLKLHMGQGWRVTVKIDCFSLIVFSSVRMQGLFETEGNVYISVKLLCAMFIFIRTIKV